MIELPFKNKNVLITGGVSGIGKASVERFHSLGANIIIIDTDFVQGKILASLLNRQKNEVRFYKCDISEEMEVKSVFQKIEKDFEHIDICFNNAGIGGEFNNVANYSTNDWHKVIATNLTGVFLCMKYEIPRLLTRGGIIVNTASVLSLVGYENDSAYVASKYGVLGLTKNAALEYARLGIRINAISPGFTRTPLIDKSGNDNLDFLANKHPIGRVATPEEIACGVTWLCSKEASFAIGLNLLIDGGYSLS